MRIAYVPLDERPCNYEFPYLLSKASDIELVRPSMTNMGLKKRPADIEQLWKWLDQESEMADGLILSIDTLLYGGIIPSRLHYRSASECAKELEKLREIKRKKPELKVFAFQLIMRCPQYSSSDEEPDYYEHYGREIFRLGYLQHKLEIGAANAEEVSEYEHIQNIVPPEVLKDYLDRRAVNCEVNKLMLQYVADGIVDFMIIPQDDSAPYGYTARDQQKLRVAIAQHNIEFRVLMYPGADEAGCTLLARMVNEVNKQTPFIYPRYSSVEAPNLIPLYEDRAVSESIKYQILAAGGQVASSASEADAVLLINAPGDHMLEAVEQHNMHLGYQVKRNSIELLEYGKFVRERLNKPVAIADIAYANGGDLQLLKLLSQQGSLFELAGYAGWNTSSNTLGTVICQMMLYSFYGSTQAHLDFLALRFVEDFGYCSVVRSEVTNGAVAEQGLSYFGVDGQRGEIASEVYRQLVQFTNNYINDNNYHIEISDVYMPWSRMFEVGMSVKARKNSFV